ncbi:MAG: hypothetical protein NDI73_08355 [Desulfuromonadales bacterium]|nr:hypothetical protein [Desulfuromonadales bacterium]
MNCLLRWLPLLLAGLLVAACAPAIAPQPDPWQTMRQSGGSVLWLGEYRFVPPPPPWQELDLNENDLSLALYRSCDMAEPGKFPCESTMAYAEEPFGYSREFEPRAHEFLKRYLWASRVRFSTPELTPIVIDGRQALLVQVAGEEPVKHHRLQARIVFMHRGERVVAFFINQWRADGLPFSTADFAEFDRFVASFRFVKPSFYENL